MNPNRVLIVILSYNGADYLGDCLSSLKNVNYPKDQLEVLLIDNASTDNSVQYLKNNWPELKLIVAEKNLGFAAGNNIGFQYAIENNFDYVYLLNQDTVVTADFLQPVVELANTNPWIGAVKSKLLLHQDKEKINSIGNEIHYLGFAFAGGYLLADTQLTNKEITYPSGACTLFRVSALKDVGLFNPEFFMYHEDADLGWRFWLGGYKVMLAPDSVVYHKYEFSRSIKKYYYMERNRYLILLQNYKMATLLLILPAACLMDIAMFLYSFFAGWSKEEFAVYGYFFKPQSWEKILKVRKTIQKNRRVRDREIIQKFVCKIEFQEIQNPLLKYIANPIFNCYWQVVKRIIWW